MLNGYGLPERVNAGTTEVRQPLNMLRHGRSLSFTASTLARVGG
jgi:hypothetical protein